MAAEDLTLEGQDGVSSQLSICFFCEQVKPAKNEPMAGLEHGSQLAPRPEHSGLAGENAVTMEVSTTDMTATSLSKYE